MRRVFRRRNKIVCRMPFGPDKGNLGTGADISSERHSIPAEQQIACFHAEMRRQALRPFFRELALALFKPFDLLRRRARHFPSARIDKPLSLRADRSGLSSEMTMPITKNGEGRAANPPFW